MTCSLAAFGTRGFGSCTKTTTPKGCHARWPTSCKLLLSLETADKLDQVSRFPGWKLHPLKGDLKGLWSLSVSGNWRLIFGYDEKTNTADNLDLIDYH
jgi:plasmid maintenance system killer protein